MATKIQTPMDHISARSLLPHGTFMAFRLSACVQVRPLATRCVVNSTRIGRGVLLTAVATKFDSIQGGRSSLEMQPPTLSSASFLYGRSVGWTYSVTRFRPDGT